VLSEPVQQAVLAAGFRPANDKVPLSYPIVTDLGVDPAQPKTVLDVPDPQVVAAIQQSWSFVKKQADVWLVIDISGSMREDDKIGQARQAALAFLDAIEPQSRVGLVVFNKEVTTLVELNNFEQNKPRLREQIQSLTADGGTALYDATLAMVRQFEQAGDSNRIRAIVVLSDGQDTESTASIRELTTAIGAGREALNPIIIIPVAYGADADVQSLNAIARASSTSVQSGDPKNIRGVLEIISSYF
jgi:Ca-activated chloride channel family protein